MSTHPDVATLDAVLAWARSGWEHAGVLMPPPATAVVGHSFGAMLAARFAVGRAVSAYAGLSGGWQDWFGDAPFPLPLLDVPHLLVWGGPGDLFTQLSDAQWQALRRPRHRVVFAEGEHWDYLEKQQQAPCRGPGGTCPHVHSATADLLTMFLGRYLPPELATDLPGRIPPDLEPPALVLTPEQEFFAGGYLGGYAALSASADCAFTNDAAAESLLANRRSRETHSLDHPCPWVSRISPRNRVTTTVRPAGFRWCDFCFPSRADG